ncbi:Fe-S cluster assembly protein SufD [Gilvimarinus sp. SDUM040013]|uniref:Fe-S cluster assembly protein SufD n=1 Tax=Gilvimarinus gilvus TaxID=3058038 RepID=A0ABU4RWF4_9GAMM|nr:Fe-S cluster assembly protein SufD [Gilvimarinus sp. SDUM040013]MDO3385132.1 Fe-S cluster assembly protein SufD [Gilvimarinus sp. SDUM040013]MDX6848507.1 Fe-S cluster assembly protein SufD [Gilvimarinus sp. SDUM040013]
MGVLQARVLELAAIQNAPAWLSDLRYQGGERFAAASWPTRRTENWKYTSLAALAKKDVAAAHAESVEFNDLAMIDADAYRLVFINGVFSEKHSDALPPQVTTFAAASEEQITVVQRHLGRLADSSEHLFAALSQSVLEQGVLIHVAAGQCLDKPIYLLNYSAGKQACLASTRNLVVLEEGAQAEVFEQFNSDGDEQSNLVASQTEVVIGNNAKFKHYRLNLEREGITHAGGVFVELGRDALYSGFALTKGAVLIRNDYVLTHRGSGAHVELNGVYLPRGKQVVDYHTNIQHCVPHCTSSEVFRGIIGDQAKAVFNGRIHIHQDAQKTLAELSNKNLLTSNKAEVDTKPELEIYADDVRCAHGATVAQLNDESLYYLQSRGIDREQAQIMMSFGFINELIQSVENSDVVEFLMPILADQFGRKESLLQMEADALESL